MKKILVLVGLSLLASCQSVEIASTPRSVSYNGVDSYTMKETSAKAQAHCAKNGRDAEFVPDGVPDGMATYKCVDR